MPTKQYEITEFYEQLALLVKSDLPLPESLAQLGSTFHKPRFKAVIDAVSTDVAAGKPLHEAMAKHSGYFPAFHLTLIKTGEDSGTLPEVLLEVARFARCNQNVLNRTKEVMCYPLFVIVLGILLLAALLRFVIPEFSAVYSEISSNAGSNPMLYGNAMDPGFTTGSVFALSDMVVASGPALFYVLTALVALLSVPFWGLATVDRVLYRALYWLPGIGRVIYCADWARVSGLLHVYLKRQIPMDESLSQTAALTEKPSLKKTLEHWVDRIRKGDNLDQLVSAPAHGADPLFSLCICHSPEDALATELNELSGLFLERADKARERAMFLWHTTLVVLMTAVVGWIVFSMFSLFTFMMERIL